VAAESFAVSAIFGLIGRNSRPVHRRELANMAAAIAAHGGDGGGIWSESSAGMGQSLKRVTPEDDLEQQPLSSTDRRLVLVSDGRLDNRAELARLLRLDGAAARQPDSAYLLGAYEKWGDACASRLVGAFAFAVWDGPAQSLLLARSSQAERPLYYYEGPDLFAFATAPKALFAVPGVPRAIDEQFLADYLGRERAEPGTCFYRHLRRLLPGHTLVLRPRGSVIRAHWLPDDSRELQLSRDEEYVEAFNEVFERVVRDHLRGTAAVGVMLSGGYDSSAVAVTAAPLLAPSGGRLHAFTEVPPPDFAGPMLAGRYADERPYVRTIAARHQNLDLAFIDTTGRFFLDNLAPLFDAAEVPYRSPSNRVWHEALLAEARQRGVGVMLWGVQGNLTISWGGSSLLSQLCRSGHWGEAYRQARASTRGGPFAVMKLIARQGVLPLVPDAAYLALARARRRPLKPWRDTGALRPAFATDHRVDERARATGADFRLRLRADARVTRRLAIARFVDLFDGVGAGYQARFNIDTRDPTGDQRIVEFCLSLPERQYSLNGETRSLVRRAMRSRWPAEILDNPGRGFQVADWFERLNRARPRIQEALASFEECDLARRAIDLPRLRQLTERMPYVNPIGRATLDDYRGTLEFGLMTGCFLQWFASTADTPVVA
jgi:asparagine synthase (glutamine-hydrolysing)